MSNFSKYIKAIKSGLPTAKMVKTGQVISYQSGDDGDLQNGREVDFMTLSENNPYGNNNRFTDELGLQLYANNLIVDWAYQDRDGTVPMWYNVVVTGVNFTNANILAQASTVGGYSDWYVPNLMEMLSILQMAVVGGVLLYVNYSPFSINNTEIWTSTRAKSVDRFNTIRNDSQYLSRPRGSLFASFYKRTATLTELGL